jgi:hypothetical protein
MPLFFADHFLEFAILESRGKAINRAPDLEGIAAARSHRKLQWNEDFTKTSPFRMKKIQKPSPATLLQ